MTHHAGFALNVVGTQQLQHTVTVAAATHRNGLQHCVWDVNVMCPIHIAAHRNTPQRTAAHRNALQHTATHCNTPQRATTHRNALQLTATHCNTPQHTAAMCVECVCDVFRTHCSTLQHTATHCSTVYGM